MIIIHTAVIKEVLMHCRIYLGTYLFKHFIFEIKDALH